MNIKDIINALKNDEVESKGGDAFFFTACWHCTWKQSEQYLYGMARDLGLITIFQTQQNGRRFLPLYMRQLTECCKKLLTAIVLRQSVSEYRG